MSKQKRKKLWANLFNFGGLYSSEPLLMKKQCNYYEEMFWDKDGNFSVKGPGLFVYNQAVKFASYNKNDVKIWMQGVSSVIKVLQSFGKETSLEN